MGAVIGKKAFAFGEQYFNQVVLSTEERLQQINPILYPNPAKTKVVLKLNTKVKNLSSFKIYDTTGRTVKQAVFSLNQSKNIVSINIELLESGLYILIDDKRNTYKFRKW